MAKLIRKYTCAYLYTDGTLIQCFEEERDRVKIGETCDVTFGYCRVDMRRYEDGGGALAVPVGRIVFHQLYNDLKGPVDLCAGGRVSCSVPSICNGSPNTQEKRLAVQYLTIKTANGYELHWTELPAVISGQFTIQDNTREEELLKPEDTYQGKLWAGFSRIWKITDLRAKPVKSETGGAKEVAA